MQRRSGRVFLVTLFTLAMVLLTPGVANAQQPNDGWSTNGKVGYCGQTSGGYVVAAQNYLWTSDAYLYVDNAWGSNSNTKMRAFQSRFGLTVDGCVGPATWNTIRSTVYSVCTPGYTCSLPNYRVAVLNGSGQISRQSWYSRTNCDWGSYIQSGINASPISAGSTYGFSSSLTGVVSCV